MKLLNAISVQCHHSIRMSLLRELDIQYHPKNTCLVVAHTIFLIRREDYRLDKDRSAL